ncbi:MAG: hypothetical protein NT074_05395 [Methanomicrobiales archaeon]|nr:hypothetical protein [Methanomicrobiales archaeon]
MRIEPGSEVKVGETVTISGLTILSPGNRILVEVYPVTFGPQPKGSSDPEGGGSGVVTVGGVPGGGPNRWSYSLNTTGFAPDTYLVTITGLDVPRYRGSGQILLYSTPGSM